MAQPVKSRGFDRGFFYGPELFQTKVALFTPGKRQANQALCAQLPPIAFAAWPLASHCNFPEPLFPDQAASDHAYAPLRTFTTRAASIVREHGMCAVDAPKDRRASTNRSCVDSYLLLRGLTRTTSLERRKRCSNSSQPLQLSVSQALV